VSIDLREIDPLYADNIPTEEESAALVYQPVIRLTRWLPAEEDVRGRGEAIGMSILCAMPSSFPEPLQFDPWVADHSKFLRKFAASYCRADQAPLRSEWMRFTREEMPPTDYVEDYIDARGCEFTPPLGRYLFGAAPIGFRHLPSWRSPHQSIDRSASKLTTAFVGEFAARASVLDLALVPIVEQRVQCVQWRNNPVVLHPWIFEGYPEHLHRVVVERGRGQKKSKRFGTICAKRNDDINTGEIFKVTFDDGSASYDMPKTLSQNMD
jgi:hypothetical protein